MQTSEEFLDRRWTNLTAWALSMVLLAAPALGAAAHLDAQISQARLVERLGSDGAPVIVDVRTPGEFQTGHVPGAINLPVQELQGRLAELRPYRNAEMVVYCEAGPRALYAGHVLAQQGFTEVRILDGHMRSWRAAGLPAEK